MSNAGRATRHLEQTHGRGVNGNNSRMQCSTMLQIILNNFEEVACGLSNEELIETPIWPEDMRITPMANIKKEAESPGHRDVRSITLAATLYCAWSSTRYKEAVTWAKNAWLHKTVPRKKSRLPSAECHPATTVEDGGYGKR